MAMRIAWLKDLRLKDLEQVGGKNASLGEMIGSLTKVGVQVPGGFATTAHAYREFLKQGGLDARIRAVSDPLPSILDGIPVDVRSIQLKLSRPGFTLNPTSCEASAVSGQVTTLAGQGVPLESRFQAGVEAVRRGWI